MASEKMRDAGFFESYFSSYCRRFISRCSRSDRNLILKKEHSFRVAGHARALAEDEGFGPRLVFLAWLAGLLHDIGRFEQYTRYNTFKDSDSVDHARLGFRILSRGKVLDSLTVRDSRCVRLAVFFHSRMGLPPGLPEDISMVSRAVRDADKLDILPVMISHFEPGKGGNSTVTLGLEDRDGITPEILGRVKSGKLGEYSRMRCLNDFKLLVCSWVYDLNFCYSRSMILDKGYIQTVFRLLPDWPDLQDLQPQILDFLKNGP